MATKRTVDLGTVGFGLGADTKNLDASLKKLKEFGAEVDRLARRNDEASQAMTRKYAAIERQLATLHARTEAVTKKMMASGAAAGQIDKVTMSYRRLTNTITANAAKLEKHQIGRGTVGMGAILGQGSVAAQQAQAANKAVNDSISEQIRAYERLAAQRNAIQQRSAVMTVATQEREAAQVMRIQNQVAQHARAVAALNARAAARGVPGSFMASNTAALGTLRATPMDDTAGRIVALNALRDSMLATQLKASALGGATTKLTLAMRDLSAASVMAFGPLSGIGARLAVLTSLFEANTAKIALFVAATAGGVIGLSLLSAAGVRATMDQQRFNAILTASTGSAALAGDEYAYVAEQANKLGLNVRELVEPYARFTTAARLSNVPLQDQRQIFEAATTASRALHLNTQRTGLVFLALEQILSKNTVSMEELRRQLGDLIPGAFGTAARAAGMSEQAFAKAVRAGEIHADLLKKIADAWLKSFGPAAAQSSKSLQAELERLRNALFELEKGWDKVTSVSVAFSAVVRGVTSTLRFLTDNMQEVLATMGALAGAGGAILMIALLGRMVVGVKALIVTLVSLRASILALGAAAALTGLGPLVAILARLGVVAAGAAVGYHMLNQAMDPLISSTQEWVDKTEGFLDIQEAIGTTSKQTIDEMHKGSVKRLEDIGKEIAAVEAQIAVDKVLEDERLRAFREYNKSRNPNIPPEQFAKVEENLLYKDARIRLKILQDLRDKLEAELKRIDNLKPEKKAGGDDDESGKAWDSWIKRVEKALRATQALGDEVKALEKDQGHGMVQTIEAMAKAVDFMESMPEKAGSLEVISKMFAAAGFTGKTFTEQLAAMFLQMDKFGESKKELEAFPGIFKDASLAVGEMFRDLRAQKTEAVLGDMFPTLGDFSQFSRAMEKFHEQLGKMNLTQEQLTFNTTEFIQQWREATIAADLGKFRRELDDADRAAAEGILAYLKAIDDETMMMGMSNKERVRAIDLLRLEEIRGNLTSSAYDRLAGTLELARQKQEALNGSWAFGAKAALNEYLNVVRNVADHIGEMFSNGFRMAEDALINFTSTGKLEIRDFATYVIRELLRMQIREHILGPLTQVLRGLIPGAAGATSGSSLVNLGYADPNSNWGGIGYVPRDMLSMVHKGERVITASENRRGMSSGGGGGGGGITVINHNTFGPGVDTGQIAIMLAQNRRLTIATVEKMMYRGEPISRMRR